MYRIPASIIEHNILLKRLAITEIKEVGESPSLCSYGSLRPEVQEFLDTRLNKTEKILVYCNSVAMAEVVHKSYISCLITGKTPKRDIPEIIETWKSTENLNTLVVTDCLSTGFDGLQKICNHLIIVEDTQDETKRVQLIGRLKRKGQEKEVIIERLIYK